MGEGLEEETQAGMTRDVFLLRSASGLVGVSSLAGFLAACGRSSDQPSGQNQVANGKPPSQPTGTLRVGLAADPVTLDPSLAFGSAVSITHNIYDGLVSFNDDYSELVPALATKWDVSDDAREWTFTLRQGVKFQDGAELDAGAVRDSFEYYVREASVWGLTVGQFTEIDASDPGVVTIRYKTGFPDLARNFTIARIVSPKLLAGSVDAVEKRVGEAPAGTGPFQFVSRASGRSVRTEAFAGYWGEGPYIKDVEFVVIPEESARVSALLAGDVDLITQVPPTAVSRLEQDTRRARVVSADSWTGVVLNMATDAKPFDDVRVRHALAHAVDREAIVKSVLRGQAKVNGSAMPPGTYGHKEPGATYPHDPARSRQLLNEAGYSGKVPVRLGAFAEFVLASELAQAIAAQLDEGGFDTTFDVLDSAVAVKDINAPQRKHQVFIIEKGWVNGGPFHFTLASITTESHYQGKELLDLIAKMSTMPDGPEREQVIAQAQEVTARELPEFPLWVPARVDAVAADLQAYVPPKNVFTVLGDAYWLTNGT